MSFSDTIFLFFLALILFGPKRLPEMARKAGRLMAELRRASNEFRSQIETEIAHLEVGKSQTALPPTPTPQGTVGNLNLAPAIEPPHELPGTFAGPVAESASQTANSAAVDPTPVDPVAPSLSTPPEAAAKNHAPTAQESHV